MKKITLSVVLFVVLLSIAGFFAGAFVSPFFMPEYPGLAGGAMVLYYAVLGMAIGFITGIVLWRFFQPAQIKWLNRIVGVACLVVLLWLTYRYVNRERASGEFPSESPKTTKPAAPTPSTIAPADPVVSAEDVVTAGLGMARPILEAGQRIDFYPNATAKIPTDSLIFGEGPYHLVVDETSSPIVPEHLKLDYQICFFVVKSAENNRLEVVINKQDGQTAWVKKEQIDVLPWPMFLISMHSVEPKNWNANPVRNSPSEQAGVLGQVGPNHILEAKSRSGDWLNVVISDENYQTIRRGWIRWRKNGKLILHYNLMS
jgi:hypothetical protein